MDTIFIFNLRMPCKNRGVAFENNNDGTVTMNGNRFETMRECENYLEQFQRIDL